VRVGTMAWATAIGYSSDAFAGDKPQTLADFFDVERFPGNRGLQRDPRIIMEWALLVDGVPADEVYEVLATPEGVDQAFAVMDPIKPFLVWWEEGNEPIDMLDDGSVALTSIWGGEMTDAILRQGHDITPIWDGLVLKLDHFGVLAGSPNQEKALEFIRFATTSQRLAEQVKHLYISPARQSSMALLDEEIKAYLPTTPEHMKTAVENDAEFWAENQVPLQQRFEEWLEVPLQKGLTGAPR
jgi:putative spermidine/putrescine transport system substrate-binding protein